MRVAVLAFTLLAFGVGAAQAKFGLPVNLGAPINTMDGEAGNVLSPDGHTFIFCCDAPSGYGLLDLYTSQWDGSAWSAPVNLGPNVNTGDSENKPELSPDGLTLYFRSNRAGGMGGFDIYVSEWTGTEWGPAHPIDGNINTEFGEVGISISADGLQRYVSAARPEHPEYAALYISEWDGMSWTPLQRLPGLELLSGDHDGDIGPSGDWMIMGWLKPGASQYDLYYAQRIDGVWQTPITLGSVVNSLAIDWYPRLSASGDTLFFTSFRSGGYGSSDIWMSVNTDGPQPGFPFGDLNCDGVVNPLDVIYLVNSVYRGVLLTPCDGLQRSQ